MFELIITIILLGVGYWLGGLNETKHFEKIEAYENQLKHIKVRTNVGVTLTNQRTVLVCGNVVVASDYFKNFVGAIKNLFGGRLTTHEKLLERARREAVIRLKQKAAKENAVEVVDVHMETVFLDQLGVEVSAYGTAVCSK